MKNRIRYMTLAGIFCAMTFVFTAYLHIPVYTGYAHIGDGFIYLAACLLPLPYGIFVGGIGAFLADMLTGYMMWAPASLVIKSLTVVFFSRKAKRVVCARNILALIPAWLLCIGGYYFYEGIITGNFISPLASVTGNIIQSSLSTVVFIVVGVIIDKLNKENNL